MIFIFEHKILMFSISLLFFIDWLARLGDTIGDIFIVISFMHFIVWSEELDCDTVTLWKCEGNTWTVY